VKITREWDAAPWVLVGADVSVPAGEAPLDCCNPVPPIDRAHGSNSAAVTPSAAGSSGIVQTKVGAWGTNTVTFDTTPTNGSTLVAALFGNGSGGQSDGTVTTTGWTRLVRGTHDNDEVAIWRKVAGASEPSVVTVVPNTPGLCRLVLYEVGGSVNVSGATTDDSAASPLTGPTLVASVSTGVLIAAFASQVATYAGDPTQTPQGDLVTDSFSRQSPGRYVSWVGHEDTVPGSYIPTLTTTPLYAGRLTATVAVNLSATVAAATWSTPAPNTIDADDTSYQAITGTDVLRIDLGDPFVIVRSRLFIGSQNAGSRSYTIRGANAADFSDAVTLDSESWTATGSYTGDDIEFLWTTSTAYQYFELTGTSETRRVYSWELYEADQSLGEDHTHTDLQSQIDLINGLLDNTNPTLPAFVQGITAEGSNMLARPIANFAAGSNIWLTLDAGPGGSIPSNTIRIHGLAGSGAAVSAGSNSTRVSEVSTAGASTTLWSPFDHAHDGIGTITASSSNTMQRGTWNIRPGSGIAIGLTDTDGDGEFDTATISTTSGGGGGGGASGLVFLEAHTASASATLDFTTFISSTYEEYLIVGRSLIGATTSQDLLMRVGTGGGPTYDASSNYYGSYQLNTTVVGYGPITYYKLAATAVNNAAYGHCSFSITLNDPQNTANNKSINGTSQWHNGSFSCGGGLSGLWAGGTGALTAVRFLFASGNITSGTIRIYGIAKS
jgi:hypothetical protein